MWGTCKTVNFSWLLFATLVTGQNLLTQKAPFKMEFKYIFYQVNGLSIGLCILCLHNCLEFSKPLLCLY